MAPGTTVENDGSVTGSLAAGAAALLVAALVGCTAPTAGTVDEPPMAETVTFRAELEPSGVGAPATYLWSPDPLVGQGTEQVTFDAALLGEVVQVEVLVCEAYYAGAFDTVDAASLPTHSADVLVERSLQAPDADDFRFLQLGQSLTGTISPGTDIDIYYFAGTAGQSVSFRMNRTSGTVDPFLELYSPAGTRVAFNDNGGGGVNAFINGTLLTQTGRYALYAYDRSRTKTGSYIVSAHSGADASNPPPTITFTSPASAVGTPFGSDFWVAIYGSGFLADSQVRINGMLRPKFYSSSSLMYIRLYGSDIGLPWPRLAFITVANPTPGGGTSNSRAFEIRNPFFGETEIENPLGNAVLLSGVSEPFSIRWAHPTDSWRIMEYMELRLVDVESDEIRVRVRATEGEDATSTLGVHDADGNLVDEGLPGELRTIASAGVSLDLFPSTLVGSGMEVTMEALLSFAGEAEGTYRMEFFIMPKEGDAQDIDVLGTLRVVSPACAAPFTGVSIVPVP